MMNGSSSGSCGRGMSFPQTLVNQTPVFDNRRRHNKGPKKHRGNKYRKPNYLK